MFLTLKNVKSSIINTALLSSFISVGVVTYANTAYAEVTAAEITAQILPLWSPPQSALGQKITVYITVDDEGNILEASTNMPNSSIEKSVLTTIYAASPFKPLNGSGYSKIQATFTVE